jgi:antitoxin StbD
MAIGDFSAFLPDNPNGMIGGEPFKVPLIGLYKARIGAPGATMVSIVLAEVTASVSELKRNPMGTVAAGDGAPVAILNRNEPAFYCVPAKAYEAMMDRLEDFELNALADSRASETVIKVTLDEL